MAAAKFGDWVWGSSHAWNDGDYGFSAQARIKVVLLSQNVANNTSTVRFTSAVYWSGDSILGPSLQLYDTCAGQVLYNGNIRMGPEILPPTVYNGLRYCLERDVTITHDAQGNAVFDAYHRWGNGQVSATYTLPQINRRATITSVNNFTVGNTTNIYFSNPASYWLNLEFFVWDGVDWEPRIFSRQLGPAQYFTIGFSEAEINAIYAQLGSATTGTGLFRLRTYSDSGYTNQVGGYHDVGVTLSVNTAVNIAYVKNKPNFTVGDNFTLNLHNPRSYYLRFRLYVYNGSTYEPRIMQINIGRVSSYTTALTTAQINAIYTQMKNRLSSDVALRIYTYYDSGYSQLVGDYKQSSATATINQATNKPTFTNYDLVSDDKAITVKDSYNNELATTTTNTLTGSNEKIIKGVSKAKVSITSANKMVAKNQADAIRYRMVNGDRLVEASYKASETVNLLIDNVTSKDVSVTAYDSRNLTTSVSKSFSNIANYAPPTAWSLTFRRDSNVEDKTKLLISGKFWKEYFGGGSNGVLNTITAHYRFKETTQAWGSQTWNSLAVTSNAEGDISFNDYINGDKGVNGFDKNKSYSVEVRLYDKVSSLIVQAVLSKGTPLLDFTTEGVGVKGKYDESEGGELQIKGQNILNWFYPVGTIYTTTSSALDTVAKVNAYFGGSWEFYGAGRTLVGVSSDTEFDAVDKESGSKYLQKHAHSIDHNHNSTPSGSLTTTNAVAGTAIVARANNDSPITGNSGETGTGEGGNIQPSKAVYRYRRIA